MFFLQLAVERCSRTAAKNQSAHKWPGALKVLKNFLKKISKSGQNGGIF